MSFIVAGVDGGGSKTHVIITDEAGTKVGEAFGAGSAVRPGTAEHAATVIASTLAEALASCHMAGMVPRMLCVGVAGAGREGERDALLEALGARELAEELIVVPDFTIALEDAFGEGPGILLISGTGSAAFGRSPSGASARCGGWGPVCGDEGSGAWIGRRALSVVTASADGREPETALVGAVLTAAQVNEPQELVAWAAQATPAVFASLAPVVSSVADAPSSRSPWRSWSSTSARWPVPSSATSGPPHRWHSPAASSRAGRRCASDSSSACAPPCPVRRWSRRRSIRLEARCGTV